MSEQQVKPGIWQHYKGGYYTVLCVGQDANNSADRDPTVVYVSHTTGRVYTRHVWEFLEDVYLPLFAGQRVPRFVYMGEDRKP